MKRGCDRFKELMLDLAYDELEAELAEQLREHAAECAGCREELQSILLTRKLAAQLPEPEPPALRDAEILELAAAAATEHAEALRPERLRDAAPPHRPATVEPPVPFLDRLRGLLLRPALVTAAVASVVFVVSYFVGTNVIGSGAADKAAESGAPFVGPAVPLDSTAELEPERQPSPDLGSATATAEREEGRAIAMKRDLQPAGNLATGGKLKGAPQGSSLGTAGPLPQNSADKLSPQPEPQLQAAPPAQLAEPYGGEAEAADDMDWPAGLGAADVAAESKAKAAAPAAPLPKAEEAEAYYGGDARYYRDGMAAYNRGDCPAATISLRKVVDPPNDEPSLVAPALHHLARCEKRTGRCGKAVVAYDELLNRFPGYQGRSEAMWEAAGCHRRLGHIDRAWKLLDGLAEIPAWRDRARTEQQNLEQLKSQK